MNKMRRMCSVSEFESLLTVFICRSELGLAASLEAACKQFSPVDSRPMGLGDHCAGPLPDTLDAFPARLAPGR